MTSSLAHLGVLTDEEDLSNAANAGKDDLFRAPPERERKSGQAVQDVGGGGDADHADDQDDDDSADPEHGAEDNNVSVLTC